MAGTSPSIFGGAQPVFGKESEIAGVDLNLTPLMDVMSNILFFLMASVGASVVALLPASLPTRSDSAEASEPAVDQVLLTLQITTSGFIATASNERLGREQLAALRFELPKTGQGWDGMPYDTLTARLAEWKQKYKASDTAIILPESTVPYDVIIKTMDASRGTGQGRLQNLFTKVVISDLVK